LAAGEKFWPMFEELAKSESPLDRRAVVESAVAVGLDRAAFEAALDAAATTESIERDQAEEMRRAVNGSPAIFIGDIRIDGLQAARVYKAAIDAAVATQRNTQAAVAGR